MARVTRGVTAHARQRKIQNLAKGYRGRSKNCYRAARRRVEKGLQYAYRDRKKRKSDFRRLWIQRINAAARLHGLTYGRFIDGLNKASVSIDRKIFADIAVHQPEVFKELVAKAEAGLKAAA